MFAVFVVTEVVSIALEKVTAIDEFFPIEVELSTGLVEATAGRMPSTTMALLFPSEPDAPGEGSVRFALLPAKSLMVPELSARELVAA